MSIIIFLLDTSSSMHQTVCFRSGVRKSYLDISKNFIENFLKCRQKQEKSAGDRYMLITSSSANESPETSVKCGWKENIDVFFHELKQLECLGRNGSWSAALNNVYDMLNIFRMQAGVETYGYGRCPFHILSTYIIILTDGGRSLDNTENFNHRYAAFTKQPYRWDQKVYAVILRMSQPTENKTLYKKIVAIEQLCTRTGGSTFNVLTETKLNSCIGSLMEHIKSPGVVAILEKLGKDFPLKYNKQMISFKKTTDLKQHNVHWPLPESYRLNKNSFSLQSREAHPTLNVKSAMKTPNLPHNFPVDKYELVSSKLTRRLLLESKLNECWPVYMKCDDNELATIGFLKAELNNKKIYLYVLPYNYTALFHILRNLGEENQPAFCEMKDLTKYISLMPPYYRTFLRQALNELNLPIRKIKLLLPKSEDNFLPPFIAQQLIVARNKASEAHLHFCEKVKAYSKQHKTSSNNRSIECLYGEEVFTKTHMLQSPYMSKTFEEMHKNLPHFTQQKQTLPVPRILSAQTKSYTNPFDIPRRNLIEDLSRMHQILLNSNNNNKTLISPKDFKTAKRIHCRPISKMGCHKTAMQNNEKWQLRKLNPVPERRNSIFGNPYNLIKTDDFEEKSVEVFGQKTPKHKGAPLGHIVTYQKFKMKLELKRAANDTETGTNQASNVQIAKRHKRSGSILKENQMENKLTAHKNAIRLHNQHLRAEIFKVIRRPGHIYTHLLQQLSLIQGDFGIKSEFIEKCICETKRFRRQKMAATIENWWEQNKK